MQDFEKAISRLPRWVMLLATAGTVLALAFRGVSVAGGFLIGSLCAYVNLRMIEKAANRLERLAVEAARQPRREGEEEHKPGGGTGAMVFFQFSGIVMAALVILSVSGFSQVAAFAGLMVCPAAVLVEIVYELATFKY